MTYSAVYLLFKKCLMGHALAFFESMVTHKTNWDFEGERDIRKCRTTVTFGGAGTRVIVESLK